MERVRPGAPVFSIRLLFAMCIDVYTGGLTSGAKMVFLGVR